MTNIFQNYQVKKSLVYLIIIAVLMSFSSIFAYKLGVSKVEDKFIEEEASIIGRLSTLDKESINGVIEVITKGNTSEEDIKVGMDILSEYGYSKESLYKLNDMSNSGMNIIIISILVVIALSIVKEILYYKEFYSEINRLNNSLEKIIDGDYSIRTSDGKEGQFYVLTKNINRLVEIVEESISSLKEEKEFLKEIISDISHQLKTPLSTLSIYNELIEGKRLGKTEEEEVLKNSRRVLDKMEWLIINLLKLAKFEVKAVNFNKSSTSIKYVIDSAVKAIHGKSLENDNNICIKGDDVLLNIDGEWIEEGFVNIIKNAIEHSNKGENINIEINDNIIWTKIIVEDFGEGIDEKDKNKIFQRFYKSKNSKPDSIGIGLSLSKSIFEGNGALIEVSSNLGVGTRFIVTFLKI